MRHDTTGYQFYSGRQKIKFKGYIYKYRQIIIRNTEQHQLFNKFLHEGSHSVLIEILLCDLARKVAQQQKKNEAVF